MTVDAKGRVVGVEPAEGRENVPMHTRTGQGRTLVVPWDAQRLIDEGVLDERLFDIDELNSATSRAAYGRGVKVIVDYRGPGARAARDGVRAAGSGRALASLNADAVTVPAPKTAAFWKTLTRDAGGERGRTAASGIGRIWLDGVYTAAPATGVERVGAPRAWAKGLDGTGVRIAVLDSGVDGTHPDLVGQVVAEKNFSPSPDTRDRFGRGTHTASVAVGTGARSGGVYKGMAPGAEVLSGKVLDDDGFGTESAVIAAVDWAVAEGADIVNLGLSGRTRPGIGPLEAHVNRVAAERGVLFAVPAGDLGPGARSITSPGRAEGALTVGAVDGEDRLAEFSGQGPGTGSGPGVKPDLTAPGVDITAAASTAAPAAPGAGQSPPGHVSFTGTAAAVPHVAGAAALLKQQHPAWKSAELRSALAGSAKDVGRTPQEQGTGRVAVDRAVEQRVFAERPTLNLGVQRWPHTDDRPVTEPVVYRNTGSADVTLDLTVTATGPDRKPAPEGFFTLGARRITVPAGSTARVDLTADTRLGDADGSYTAAVVATGDGRSVRATATVERESESYDLTVRHIGRDGRPGRDFRTWVRTVDLDFPKDSAFGPADASGTAVLRLPKGVFFLQSVRSADPRDSAKGFDWLSWPKLSLDRDLTVTLDARTTRPVDITPPGPGATPSGATAYSTVRSPGVTRLGSVFSAASFEGFRTAQLGPDLTDGSLTQSWDTQWTRGGKVQYSLLHGGPVDRFATGYTKRFTQAELATVKLRHGASAPGKRMVVGAVGQLPHGVQAVTHGRTSQPAPGVRTLYASGIDGATWTLHTYQHGTDGDEPETAYFPPRNETFEAGGTYTREVNTPVFGPAITGSEGVFREGDEITGRLSVFADGTGHEGWSQLSSARTTLHRGRTKIGENTDPLGGEEPFTVGPDDASYTLATSVERPAAVARAGSRIDASWTFRSRRPAAGEKVALPVSVARFSARVGLDGTAPAGQTQRVPVTVRGAAAGDALRRLTVHVSYDGGEVWQRLPVTRGAVSVRNPARGRALSLRAEITDKQGNRSATTLHDAYFGR
ncbi:S8 family peptidase [Streptomyces sp. NPDC020141]|uniref:S8 family peptidase n=1 Tax=Streptomyces sp. NPDC020141 TaxID=3365065 RepID=UPI0037A6F186